MNLPKFLPFSTKHTDLHQTGHKEMYYNAGGLVCVFKCGEHFTGHCCDGFFKLEYFPTEKEKDVNYYVPHKCFADFLNELDANKRQENQALLAYAVGEAYQAMTNFNHQTKGKLKIGRILYEVASQDNGLTADFYFYLKGSKDIMPITIKAWIFKDHVDLDVKTPTSINLNLINQFKRTLECK